LLAVLLWVDLSVDLVLFCRVIWRPRLLGPPSYTHSFLVRGPVACVDKTLQIRDWRDSDLDSVLSLPTSNLGRMGVTTVVYAIRYMHTRAASYYT
jgi:hypothetical protein